MINKLIINMSVDNILYEKIPGAQCAFNTFESFIAHNEDSKDLMDNLMILLIKGNFAKPSETYSLANQLYLHYLRTKLNIVRQAYKRELEKQPVLTDDDLYA